MWKLLLVALATLNLACCSIPPAERPECKDIKIYISRLEKEIFYLQDRPMQSRWDGRIDTVLIRALKEQSIDLQNQYMAYCTE